MPVSIGREKQESDAKFRFRRHALNAARVYQFIVMVANFSAIEVHTEFPFVPGLLVRLALCNGTADDAQTESGAEQCQQSFPDHGCRLTL
jgi:hypothetical protein